MRIRFSRVKRGLKKGGFGALALIERMVLAVTPDKPVETLWIIGPPRSGTTLLFQVLVQRYELAYMSNFTARFYMAPVVASWAARRLFRPQDKITDFESHYGMTANWLGPHEAGPFWYRWFPKGDYVYVPPGSASQEQLSLLRREVSGLSRVFRAPALFKNVFNTMRIAPIVETFPNACFLVCHRDPVDIAQSILNGRMNLYNDKSRWMGVKPKEIDQIKDHPYWEQVAEQVYYTYQQIAADRQRYGSDRFFEVHYEQLCAEPHRVLRKLEQFLSVHHIRLNVVGELPERFPFSSEKQVDDADYRLIQQAVAKLWT